MELNITEVFNSIAPDMLSNGVANIGADAAAITWRNAMSAATGMQPLDSAAKREAFRRYLRGFGAWTADEISAYTPLELNALLLQCIAADMREGGLDGDSGRLFRGDDGQIYYYLGE